MGATDAIATTGVWHKNICENVVQYYHFSQP